MQDAQELFQMVMRLVGEEAAVCLKNRDKENLVRMSEIDGAGGFADLNPEVQPRPMRNACPTAVHYCCLL